MEQHKKILFLGYTQSGKSKILFQLVLHDSIITIPTIGFNVENVQIENENIAIWDIGGKTEIIPLWIHYYAGISGIVFVIDRNNEEDLQQVVDSLTNMLDNELLEDIPIAFFMNKGDLEEKVTFEQIRDKVGEEKLNKHPYNVFQTTSTDEGSILEGLNWLVSQFGPSDAAHIQKED